MQTVIQIKMKFVCHTIQIYKAIGINVNMSYHKYKYMLDNELESYLSYLYIQRKLTLNGIADDLGCSEATASRLCKKYKVPIGGIHKSRIPLERYGCGTLRELLILVSECLKAGMNKKQIAENIGCSRRTIIRLCNKYGI